MTLQSSQMNNMGINNIRYADFMEMVFDKLQTSINAFLKGCSKWRTKINATKCDIMSDDPHGIMLNGNPRGGGGRRGDGTQVIRGVGMCREIGSHYHPSGK